MAQNVFVLHLLENLAAAVPDLDSKAVILKGATELQEFVVDTSVGLVVISYNEALSKTFYVAVALASLAMIGALGVEWKSVRAKVGTATSIECSLNEGHVNKNAP